VSRWHGLRLQSAGRRGQTEDDWWGVNKTYLLPSLDLSVGVNIWDMGVCPSRRVDDGGLSYQERSRDRRTLGVILHAKLGVNVVLGRSRAGERRKDDAMREGHSTDLDGCEESRRLGERRHLL